jgi:hypothetical protein
MLRWWAVLFFSIILPAFLVFGIVFIDAKKMESSQLEKWFWHMERMDKRYGIYREEGYQQREWSGDVLKLKKINSKQGHPVGLMFLDDSTGYAYLLLSKEIPGNAERYDNELLHRTTIRLDGQFSTISRAHKHDAHLYQKLPDGEMYRVYHVVLTPGNMVLGVCPNRSEAITGVLFENGGKVYGDTRILRNRIYR